MQIGLSLDYTPIVTFSSFRHFEKHERHMTRICSQSVLIMVYDGVLRFYEDGNLVEVHAGEYYIQRNGLRQEGSVACDSPAYYFIHMSGCRYMSHGNILPLRGRIDSEELMPLFKKLETLYLCRAPVVEKAMIVFKILLILKDHGDRAARNPAVMKVISAVSADLQTPFSLQEIAAKCGYNKNHIISIFKKETGKTPYAYITEMKLSKAKRLLLNSDASLAQISVECGFGEYINLYKAFVKAEGCPPLVWKKENAVLLEE